MLKLLTLQSKTNSVETLNFNLDLIPCSEKSVWPDEIFIQKSTLYNWQRLKSWLIFYNRKHYRVWWNTLTKNILYKTFSYQSIAWKVLHACLFSFKVRESNVSFELHHIFSQLQIFYHNLQSWLDLLTAIINERCIYQPGLKGFKATKLN